jgi:hypothetical protein
MASTYKQRSLRRKLIYFGLILALFTISLIHRLWVVEPASYNLQLRAVAQGQAELTSSAVRLSMFGSRGLATAILWPLALEHTKRHQWNKLELVVKSITVLQPNFVTPWLFQSWNLSFNVAVECDRTRDKYFYITRGMQLLAEGERRHQGSALAVGGESSPRFPGNPDMRFYEGVFYLRKIGLSDEKNAMRCLFDMSCIDPRERDPAQFWGPDHSLKLAEFLVFCKRHPRLVRRLRQTLECERPADVIEFLERNQGIPSRFDERSVEGLQGVNDTPLLPAEEQFPVLPPSTGDALIPDRSERAFTENFDVFTAARAWYEYAQEPLPPIRTVAEEYFGEVDLLKYRIPKMSVFIFRSFPARSQEYIAEGLQEEGWFDDEGWRIRDWFSARAERSGEDVVVGRESKYNSGLVWAKAFDLYTKYGKDNSLLMTEEQTKQLEKEAQRFRNSKLLRLDIESLEIPIEQVKAEGPAMLKSYQAHQTLQVLFYRRATINFGGHYFQSQVEKRPETVAARKLFFQAEVERSLAAEAKARALYEDGFQRWFEIMLAQRNFRELDNIQAETYEKEQLYMYLLEVKNQKILRPLVLGMAEIGMIEPRANPLFSSLLGVEMVALKQTGKLDEKNFLPLRRISGPMEWVYFYTLPFPENREALLDYLTVVTQPPGMVPFALTNEQREGMLTNVTTTDRIWINQRRWVPLVPDITINNVGVLPRVRRWFER